MNDYIICVFVILLRGWCFKNETIMKNYDPKYYDKNDLNIDKIIKILKDDLILNRKVISYDKLDKMNPYNFALYLMDEYIELPKPEKGFISII